MEPSAAIILFSPILYTVIGVLQIHPVHFGVMIIVNLTIGMVTPPVGTVLYATCAASGVGIKEISVKLIPFIGIAILILLTVAFFPVVS